MLAEALAAFSRAHELAPSECWGDLHSAIRGTCAAGRR